MAVAEISIFTLLLQSNRITIFRGYGFLTMKTFARRGKSPRSNKGPPIHDWGAPISDAYRYISAILTLCASFLPELRYQLPFSHHDKWFLPIHG